MNSKTFNSSILFIFLPASLALAAGVIDLPVTGQTTCYSGAFDQGQLIPCDGTGQDGDLRAGVAWPIPRFTNPDNSLPIDGDCVLDRLTGLIWARNADHGYTTWSEAVDTARNVSLCGYTDWHLPNVAQLESLINLGESSSSSWLSAQGFINVRSASYWSSTTFPYSSGEAWYVYMVGGNSNMSWKTNNFYVWPVRSPEQSSADPVFPANVWKTGQTTSYYSGDDGDLQRGVSWPDPRFTDNVDGTVTDNLTGLMWLKDADCIVTEYPAYDPDGDGKLYWIEALDFIDGMNDGTYANCNAGYFDWRLPNRKELLSLVDRSQGYPPLAPGYPFINVQMDWYFSSTTHVYYTQTPWAMLLWNGYVNILGYLDFYVWPVRGGVVGEEVVYFCDKDNDGFADSVMEGTCTGTGCEPPDCQTTVGNDCDDNDPFQYPGQTWYEDLDGDGFTSGNTVQQCGRPVNYKLQSELVDLTVDCNDNDPQEYPQALWYGDTDGDGYGDSSVSTQSCPQPDGYVANDLDCDDTNAAIYPGATEICDNLDNNCEGSVDENVTRTVSCGIGECVSTVIETCTAGVWQGDTCVPGPKAEETDVTCDGLDGDCDGQVDEDYVTTATTCGVGQCTGTTGQLECQNGVEVDTCDPLEGASTEVCDGVDNNCNGEIDDSTCTATPEITSPLPGSTLSGATETFYWTNNDTEVFDWWLWVGSTPISNDIFNSGPLGNSTSTTVTGLPTDGRQLYVRLWYYTTAWEFTIFEYTAFTDPGPDGDGDGYSIGEGDCDDTNAAIHPGATEICDDLDNNCDGTVDEGLPLITWYFDNDRDGYGDPLTWQAKCNEPLPVEDWVEDNTDYNDNDPNIYPGGPPVRIAGAVPSYFWTLQEAYTASLDGETLQVQAAEFIENLSVDHDKSVTLLGGYDGGYTVNDGDTLLTGSMDITAGTLTIEKFILQ